MITFNNRVTSKLIVKRIDSLQLVYKSRKTLRTRHLREKRKLAKGQPKPYQTIVKITTKRHSERKNVIPT